MGRIAEAKEEYEAAADFYRQSLKLRSNDEVLTHLFRVDEYPGVLPCTKPRPFNALLACIKHITGKEPDSRKAADGVYWLTVPWQPDSGHVGRWSVYLAAQNAAGWQIFFDVGRYNDRHPCWNDIEGPKRAAWRWSEKLKYLQIEYDNIRGCAHQYLREEDIPGLKQQKLEYSSAGINTHRLFFTLSASGLLSFVGDVVVGCKGSRTLEESPELLKSLPAEIRRKVSQVLNAKDSSRVLDPMLSPDGRIIGIPPSKDASDCP